MNILESYINDITKSSLEIRKLDTDYKRRKDQLAEMAHNTAIKLSEIDLSKHSIEELIEFKQFLSDINIRAMFYASSALNQFLDSAKEKIDAEVEAKRIALCPDMALARYYPALSDLTRIFFIPEVHDRFIRALDQHLFEIRSSLRGVGHLYPNVLRTRIEKSEFQITYVDFDAVLADLVRLKIIRPLYDIKCGECGNTVKSFISATIYRKLTGENRELADRVYSNTVTECCDECEACCDHLIDVEISNSPAAYTLRKPSMAFEEIF